MIPGPRSRALARRLGQVESRNITYLSNKFPVFWQRAKGSHVWDVDGNKYLDLTSGFGVASLGHQNPSIRAAMARQASQMWHGMGDVHPNAVKVELLEKLAALLPKPLAVTILSNSGAEAVESALKTAALYTGRPGVLAFDGGYHGLTYGTLLGTHRADFRTPFARQLAPVTYHALYPDHLRGISDERALESVETALKGATQSATPAGAIVVEPIQGRGGIRIGSPAFLKGLKALAWQYGALLVADEIFTGLGRTGDLLAMEPSGVIPDLLCLGKALANGFPISACVGSRGVMAAWPRSDGEAIHTSTFLGNPLGCAMALESLKILDRAHLPQRAARIGAAWLKDLQASLAGHPRVAEIRGRGLMIGIELVKDQRTLEPDARLASRIVVELLAKKVIALSSGNSRNTLSLTPPLTVLAGALDEATGLLKKVIK